jgi:hypothetical protein
VDNAGRLQDLGRRGVGDGRRPRRVPAELSWLDREAFRAAYDAI